MPDGDIVRCQFARRFLRPYRKLCFDQFDPQDTAKAAIRAVKEKLKEDGDNPVKFIQACSDYLHQHLDSATGPINYGDVSRAIDKRALQYSGNPRAIELAKKALRQEVQAFRNGQGMIDTEHATYRYVMNVYHSEFTERAPLAGKHWFDQTHATVENRIKQVRPYAEKYAEHFARRVTAEGSVANLTLRPMRQPSKLGLHEELY